MKIIRIYSGKWSGFFCPEMTLAQIPEIGFFVQNSRIGVKSSISNGHYVPLAAWYELVSEWIPELASSSDDGLEP